MPKPNEYLRAAWLLAPLTLLAASQAQAHQPIRRSTQVMQVVALEPVLRSCAVGEWRLSYQAARQPQGAPDKLTLRVARYGHRYPDNTLRVSQSYDQRGQLSGVSVQVSGFAGPALSVRTAVTSKGQLLPEQGFRAKGFSTPLSSYLRTPPASGCTPAKG